MHRQGYVGRDKTNGEAARERSTERRWFVGKLHRQHEQDIDDTAAESQQYSKQDAVHRKIISEAGSGERFGQVPHVIRNASFDGGRYAEAAMNPAEVVVGEVQRHCRSVVLQLL
jgi:hypothetical protein